MKQILQSLNTGECLLEDIPCPVNSSECLLIETSKTLVSAGTERMLLEFGKAGILGKIKQQPDKVKMVLDKVKTDGLFTTLESVKAKLDQPIPLGYCNVGTVIEVGKNVKGYKKGDRVLSNGNHAEVVRVPQNLCAKIPDNVSDDCAVFTVLASIALQGLRLSKPTLGECYVVIGLGIIGLIAVQLLRAQGCRVLGTDFDEKKCALARKFGAETVNLSNNEDPISYAEGFSRGNGVDAVIITASTKSSEPLHQAATMCRKRGRIVLIGVIGNEWSRADFYEKELSLQVSCSYGPGRYDPNYEEKSHDYPIAYVRWTEQRNFQAVLDLMSSGAINMNDLMSHQFDITQAQEAYQVLSTDRSALGIILNYPKTDLTQKQQNIVFTANHVAKAMNQLNVCFVGAGNYASRMLVPAFKAAGVYLDNIVSSGGVSSKITAKKNGFARASTDESAVYTDKDTDVVVIATQHYLHAKQVIKALSANKHVFVEKPLAIALDELDEIQEAYRNMPNQLLMVGFNRRFAPHIQTMKRLLSVTSSPKTFIMTVNAGHIPLDHWTQKQEIGGGRIIGEACHFIDLLRFLAGSKIVSHYAVAQGGRLPVEDVAIITLTFEDGSCGTIQYLANGHKKVPKERLEVFCDGKILQLDNFIKMRGYGWAKFKKQNLWKQDKGQKACVSAFVDAIKSGKSAPIAFDELIEVSRVSIEIAEQLRHSHEKSA